MTEELKKLGDDIAAKQAELQSSIKNLPTQVEVDNLSKANEQLKSQIEELKTKGGVSESKLDELTKASEKLEKALATVGTDVTQMKSANYSKLTPELKSVSDQIRAELTKNLDVLKDFREKRSGGKIGTEGAIRFEVKTVGTITGSNITGASSTRLPAPSYDLQISQPERRQPFILQLVDVANTTSRVVTIVEKKNREGGAGMTAEGTAKSQADFEFVPKDFTVKKVTAYVKVAEEMVDDLDFVMGEIDSELIGLIDLKTDEQILEGDGTGQNLEGILVNAVTFAAGSLAGTVSEANNFDVIRAAVAQVMTKSESADGSSHQPTHAILNPIDAASMDMSKASDGHYIMPPFITAGGQTIANLRVIENSAIDAGDFLIGDMKKSHVRMRKALGIEVGRDGNDFTENLYTVLAERRLVHYVKSNDYSAFVQGSFTTAKAALLKADAAA